MASSKSRQRQLARDKYRRQMVRKAQSERRRRQIQAGLAGIVVVLVTLGAFWLTGAFDSKPGPAAAPDLCTWTPKNNPEGILQDVGTPSGTDVPLSGTRAMNITLTQGLVEATLDLASAPCTSASFAYLATKNFFDNTKCHRLTDALLHCGDPKGTGAGGPTYQYLDENTPVGGAPPTSSLPTPDPNAGRSFYGRGTIATYNVGSGTNGSQFLIFFKDTYLDGKYSKFGQVTKGLEYVDAIAGEGAVDAEGKAVPDGRPRNDVVIQSLTVGEVVQPAPAPTPGLTVAPDPTGTPAPAPTASTSSAGSS